MIYVVCRVVLFQCLTTLHTQQPLVAVDNGGLLDGGSLKQLNSLLNHVIVILYTPICFVAGSKHSTASSQSYVNMQMGDEGGLHTYDDAHIPSPGKDRGS